MRKKDRDKEYQAKYYKKNKKKIAKRKYQRYNEDLCYRQKAVRAAKIGTTLRAMKRLGTESAIEVQGIKERVFTLPVLPVFINRCLSLIYRWRESNVLPGALAFNSRGQSLYSESQVKYIAEILRRVDEEELIIIYSEFSKVLHAVWKKSYSKETLKFIMQEVMV